MAKIPRNRFPQFKTHSKRVNTTKLSPEDYMEKWREFHKNSFKNEGWSRDSFKEFTNKHGILVINGEKFKPSVIRGKPGPGLSGAEDFAQNKRLWRGEILTYMFGGTPKGSKAFGDQWISEAGEVMDAHHIYGNAEAAPWVDDIIEMMNSNDPKMKQQGRAMLEAGRAYFEDTDLFLGDVEENYRMFTRPQHTGDGADTRQSMHGVQGPDPDFGTDITGPQGKSPFDYENIPSYQQRSKGIMGQDPVEWIRSRPWSKEESLSFVEDSIIDGKFKKVKRKSPIPRDNVISRWSTFEDHIRQSSGIRSDLAEEVYKNPNLKTRRELGLDIPLEVETKFRKFSGKLGKADALTNFGVGIGTGNYLQAAGGAGGLLLQDEKVQTKIAKQFAKRASKSALKFIPGVDIALSGMEAWGYLTEGKWDQAGIAAASGAVGWVPIIGDAAAATLDLTNTGLDVARMDFNSKGDYDVKADADVDLDWNTRNARNSVFRNLKF